MNVQVMDVVRELFRWLHVVTGVLWIGHLYFFNFVNAHFAATLDAETKKKVVPELMPRALFWFRWGALWTWISGVLLLALVFYHGKEAFLGQESRWTGPVIGLVLLTFFSVHIYDILAKTVLKDPKRMFVVGWFLASAFTVVLGIDSITHFSFRGAAIHVGVMFGTIMAFNVWFRIWPAQKKIITAIRNGEKPDADLVALAGLRSKHNTYLSVPLIFLMLNQHMTWASIGCPCLKDSVSSALPLVILAGWLVTYWLYGKSKKVTTGF